MSVELALTAWIGGHAALVAVIIAVRVFRTFTGVSS